MAYKEITPLNKDVTNARLVDAVWRDMSMQYQQRIPQATQAGLKDTLHTLEKFSPHWNEFKDALVNRIGQVFARNMSWSNPLAEFKRGMLSYGDTIEEINVGLLQAHAYDPDRLYGEKMLFGKETPEVQSIFHRVNRQDMYRITLNEDLLKRAFLEEGGLSDFVARMMQAPTTSDEWDEFLLTCSLFAKYEAEGGFYHVHVPDVARMESNADDAKAVLRKMRALADTMRYPSTKYNASHMPTHIAPDDLVIFTTPEFNAAIDVEALAAAFNMDRMNLKGRVIPIPQDQFGVEGCQAIMTSKDFFVIADQKLENTSMYNPAGLGTNYFLHHWQVISASKFVPAVMLTTGAGQESISLAYSTTGITAKIQTIDGVTPTSVAAGDILALDADIAYSATPALAGLDKLEAPIWSVAGATSMRTYITYNGVLHVGADETATKLTVTATQSSVDAQDPRKAPITATLDITVTGQPQAQGGVVTGIRVADVDVPNFAVGTLTYSLTLPKGTTITKSDVNTVTTLPADSTVTVAKTDTGYTITDAVDGGAGGTKATYTITVTLA